MVKARLKIAISRRNSKSKSKLRIAIFHLGFFYSGGGERLVLEEIDGLSRMGHDVCCFVPVLDKRLSFPDRIRKFKIKTLIPQLPRWFPDRVAILLLLSCLLLPLLFWRFFKFDILIGANQPGPWYSWVLKKILRKPYLAYLAQPTRFLHPRKVDLEEGIRIKGGFSFFPTITRIARPIFNWADKISILGADLVLTNGEWASEMINKVYGVKNQVCPAGANLQPPNSFGGLDRFERSFKIGKVVIKKPYILLTNRHFAHKRFEYAIFALPFIKKEVPAVSLVITGEETGYTKFLKNLVQQLSLEDQVIFTGLVIDSELSKLYLNSAVYVYTAPEEDFGMGILEAQAHKVPVVAWAAGGPKFIISDGKTGFLAKPFDIWDFTSKISKLMRNRLLAERMTDAGYARVKNNFSYQVHSKILEEAIFKVLKIQK
jgi:glycosyltransferase involved in cell wall biosynthesis